MTDTPGHGNGPDPKLGQLADDEVRELTRQPNPQTWFGPMSERDRVGLGLGITIAVQALGYGLRSKRAWHRLHKFLHSEARRAGNDPEVVKWIDGLTREHLHGAYHAIREAQSEGKLPS